MSSFHLQPEAATTHAEKVAWMEKAVQGLLHDVPMAASPKAKRQFVLIALQRLTMPADACETMRLRHHATLLSLRSATHAPPEWP